MSKRKVGNEGALLPGPMYDSGGDRYLVREKRPPWTAREDLSLWPILVSCGRSSVYGDACVWLTQVLGRPVLEPPGSKWTEEQRKREATALVERRTITELLAGCPNLPGHYIRMLDTAKKQFCGHRTGLPMTWFEVARVLFPYVTNLNDQPRIPLDQLLYFLDRKERDLQNIQHTTAVLSGFCLSAWTDETPFLHQSVASKLLDYRDCPEHYAIIRDRWTTLICSQFQAERNARRTENQPA